MSTPAPDPATSADPAVPPEPLDLGTGERLLTEMRQEAARADTKSSVLVGAQGMAAAVLVSALTAQGWHPGSLGVRGQILWWAGTLCFLVSLYALLMAVTPQYRAGTWRQGMPVTHFADIRSAADHGASVLEEALRETVRSPQSSLLTALTDISRIVARKYRWLRIGTACFLASLVLLPGALLVA